MFDQNWLSELFELQKKVAGFSNNPASVDEIQDLVMNVLNKWGINHLPSDGDFRYKDWFSAKNDEKFKSERYMNIDISETKQNILVRVVIPGIEDQADLAVKLLGNTLQINGKSSSFDENEGTFNRKIRLPAEDTPSGASAVYRDNQLTVTLPKAAANGEIIPLDFMKTQS